ncbi:MAG: hypothetical protein QGI65_05920 [SAR324 cluster bacterium]|jgi:isopenicillin N synthase-like dioxygenase|nr:hypothetical protein [SAR324 cluster bacterium]|tara:strand:- start:480 stop:713 length:234 start_codon:yes stop_codon:yes gene_type:complete
MKGVSNKILTIEISVTNSPDTGPHRSVLVSIEKRCKKTVFFTITDHGLFNPNFLLEELAELKVSLVKYWIFSKRLLV